MYYNYKVKVRDFCHILVSNVLLFCLILYLSLFGHSMNAQTFEDVFILESSITSITTTHALRDGDNTYLYGQFFGEVEIGEFDLDHVGSADLFLIKLVNGQPEWVFYGGSNGSDKAIDIQIDDNGDIVIGGEFWLEAQFGDLTLMTEGSTKSLFIIKLDADGNVLSDHTINGTETKNMNGIELIGNDIYVSGSFSGSLFLSATTAIANANRDIYILRLDNGTKDGWIQHYGLEGNNDSVDFSWDEVNEQFIVSGEYVGSIAVGGDTIAINTFDQDMFVAAFNIDGEGLWLQKAGGQFEDCNEAHCLDEEGNIYLTGSYRGIINLSDGSQINTGGVSNVDAYIIKYSPEGQPLWARGLGDLSNTEIGTNIAIANDQLYWTAYHDGAFSIDGNDFPDSESTFNGLVAVFDAEGVLRRAVPLTGTNAVIPRGVIPEGQSTYLFGDFQGEVALDQIYNSSAFASFHVSVKDLILSSSTLVQQNIKVYPNPVLQFLNIELEERAEHVELFDVQGFMIYQSREKKLSHIIDFSRLGSGIYFWRTASGAHGKVIHSR